MILYITFSGKDFVQMQSVEATGLLQGLGQYDYEGQKDIGGSFLEFLLVTLQTNNLQLDDITGIIVQWGTESRFTVARLTGVAVNTLAMTRQLLAIVQASNESLEAALLRLQKTTTTAIPIEYSADPRIGLY